MNEKLFKFVFTDDQVFKQLDEKSDSDFQNI